MSLSEYTRAVLFSSTIMPTVRNGLPCAAQHAGVTIVSVSSRLLGHLSTFTVDAE